MSDTCVPPTPLTDLLRELRLFINCDADRNNAVEHFIATCDVAAVDTASLEEALRGCRKATARLAELHALLERLVPFEAVLRALAQGSFNRGPGAA